MSGVRSAQKNTIAISNQRTQKTPQSHTKPTRQTTAAHAGTTVSHVNTARTNPSSNVVRSISEPCMGFTKYHFVMGVSFLASIAFGVVAGIVNPYVWIPFAISTLIFAFFFYVWLKPEH